MSHSLVYLANFPATRAFRFHRLSEADWLRYHIETYLQETYVFYSRLNRLLRKLEKRAIACSDKSGVASVRNMKNAVSAAFATVVKTRGGHVHQYRFDAELRDLDCVVLLTRSGELRKFRIFRQWK